MPAIVGAINVVSISSSSVLNIGDVFTIAPVSTARTFAGAGSFNTGDQINVVNHYSKTNTYDSNVVDQPLAFNL